MARNISKEEGHSANRLICLRGFLDFSTALDLMAEFRLSLLSQVHGNLILVCGRCKKWNPKCSDL
jgi:hypothetical protein